MVLLQNQTIKYWMSNSWYNSDIKLNTEPYKDSNMKQCQKWSVNMKQCQKWSVNMKQCQKWSVKVINNSI